MTPEEQAWEQLRSAKLADLQQREGEALACRPIGNLTPTIMSSLEISDSIPDKPLTSSATTGRALRARKPSRPTGTPHGEPGADAKLPAIVATHLPAHLAATDALEASLKPWLSLEERRNWEPADPEHVGEILGYAVKGRRVAEAVDLIDEAMQPASRSTLVKALAKMRVLTAGQAKDTADMALTLGAFAEYLDEQPGDVILEAINQWPRTHKWWPTLIELIDFARGLDHKRYALLEFAQWRGR